MGLKSGEIDNLLIRQLKQTANKPVTRLVLLTGFNTPPTPSQEGRQLQPVNKQIVQLFLNWHIGILPHWLIIFYLFTGMNPSVGLLRDHFSCEEASKAIKRATTSE